MSKRNEGNRGKEIMRGTRMPDARSPQKVCCTYCDVALKKEVIVLDGPKEVPYRGIPVGWVSE